MQFFFPRLEIDIAEGLEPADRGFRKTDEHAPVAGESLQVQMTLTIEICAHLLDLKIGHITQSPAQSAFMISLTSELKTFYQASFRQQLAGNTDEFGKTKIASVNTDDM